MSSTKKFGAYLSKLRKKADMTQSDLAEKLNLTRQAVSKYEVGDSFPDISVLILIADVFKVSLDELINSGEPTKGEKAIFVNAANDKEQLAVHEISDIVNLAPLLKPSILDRMAQGLSAQGIDISNVVTLAEYLSDESVLKLLENATYETLDDKMLEKLIPFLDEKSKVVIFERILEGDYDWHLLKAMLPYADYITSQIEEAVIEGVLPYEALKMLKDYVNETVKMI